jgi:hypothetical protein
MSVVHDPDCPCHKRVLKEWKNLYLYWFFVYLLYRFHM